MATQAPNRPRPQNGQPTTTHAPQRSDAESLLEQVLARTPAKASDNPNVRLVDDTLEMMAPHIEKLVPPKMRGQGAWLCAVAAQHFRNNPNLRDCPPVDFCRAVGQAAQMGLAIDGQLCYCVKFKSVYQALPDWKGLVAVARSARLIKDCQPFVVKENDRFSYVAGEKPLHEYPPGNSSRGKVIGAYALVTLPDGTVRTEYMDLEELNKIKDFAPSKNGPWGGPFADEMYKKCPVRRAMKSFKSDPTIQRALDAEEIGAALDATEAIERAGNPDPPHFTDEGQPPTALEILQANFEAAKDVCKERKLLSAAAFTKLMDALKLPDQNKWTADHYKTAGIALQTIIDGAADAEPERMPGQDG
jgi:phage RecT family recombinase